VSSPLAGRVALVTGVSRQQGIGLAVANRLHVEGATVVASGWPSHDAETPWGTGDAISGPYPILQHDFEDVAAPAMLVDEVMQRHGQLDIVVAVHARSSTQTLHDLTADELTRSWNTNVQSILLLAQRFAQVHDAAAADEAPRGRMLWFSPRERCTR